MADDVSADFEPLVSREQAENAFRRALSLFVGRRRRYSVEDLATGSGVPERLIECYRGYPLGHPDYRPLHDGHKLSIAKFLGPQFTTEWLKPCDQVAREIGPLDHEAIADWSADYQAKSLKYRREDSECGPAIGPNEKDDLDSTVIQFPGVAA